MFKLAAVLALVFVAYLLLQHYAPVAILLAGFMIGGIWIAYYWVGLALLGWVTYRAI